MLHRVACGVGALNVQQKFPFQDFALKKRDESPQKMLRAGAFSTATWADGAGGRGPCGLGSRWPRLMRIPEVAEIVANLTENALCADLGAGSECSSGIPKWDGRLEAESVIAQYRNVSLAISGSAQLCPTSGWRKITGQCRF